MNKFQPLHTKLVSPRLQPTLVSRRSLLTRLERGLERKLTLISAPAGFGKTTLVNEWMATHHQTKVAWLALDTGDNDPIRFWRYVIAACQTVEATVGEGALKLLAGQQPPFESVLTLLINDLTALTGKFVLVLEDYHVLESQQIHETVAFLLDHLPATVHLIIMSRNQPALPLARLRARGELNELDASDLRFTQAEIQTFFQQNIELLISDELLQQLAVRTEGWAAGLRLVSLALQARNHPHEIDQFITGSHPYILEYLLAEVFSAQPDSIQQFLLQTAFLSRLTGDLCDAVTGQNHSEALLETLEQANLFIIRLEGEQHWYRYHALFAEALQSYAERHFDDLTYLRQRASTWYEQHGFLTEAIEIALSAKNFDYAATLIARSLELTQFNNEYHTLRRWLECLPEPIRDKFPELHFSYAISMLFTLNRRTRTTKLLIQKPLQKAEAVWRAEENGAKVGEVLIFRAMMEWWQGNFMEAFAVARQAFDLVENPMWRGICLLMMGYGEMLDGNLDTACQLVTEGYTRCQAVGNEHGAFASLLCLGDIYYRQGALRQAAQHYERVWNELLPDDSFLEDRAYTLIGLGLLAYEWNELDTAAHHLSRAFDIGQQLGGEPMMVQAATALARVLYASGKTTQAQQILYSLLARIHLPLSLRQVRSTQAWLALRMGDLPAVDRWYNHEMSSPVPRTQQAEEALLVARLLITQGEYQEALLLLNGWQMDAHENGRYRSELEILILKALAHQDAALSKQLLQQALTLARPEGYTRLFLDEGETMLAQLQQLLPDTPDAAYVRKLLLIQDTKLLSPQEQRVLHLLAKGFTNPEIAEQLVVSINTVKTQVKSIYRKLDVTNRGEAAQVAHQLQKGELC